MPNQVAETILQQLGGRRFITMTGAHSFTGDKDALIFKVPRTMTRENIAGVKISLMPTDTYIMEFYAFRGSLKAGNYRCDVVTKREDVYWDCLQDVFSDVTGLATML